MNTILSESIDDMEREASEVEALSMRVSLAMRRRIQQQLDAFNLTLPQYMAMNYLYRATAGCSLSELAENNHQVLPTMTGIVDRLVESGMVARERSASDRRTLVISLSGEGRAVIERINAQKRGWMRRFLENLTPDERGMIITVLRHFLHAIESAPMPAADCTVGD